MSLLYSGLIVATYKDQSVTTANVLYLAHALLNGAVVGLLVGSVARRNAGARIGGSIIAALGALFGYTNALPLIFAWEQTPKAAIDLFTAEPLLPLKTWWNDESSGGIDWFSPLGLLLAAATAWGLAYATGNRHRHP
ncbi:hypothetical protein ABZ896_29665 [Streptomyces sp. NPDC047072]|uniref:hypothetical protein n=1 Tax=Streptomyces sp. NPDC047072 TaxID=3154809 RepID=UPI0034053CAF